MSKPTPTPWSAGLSSPEGRWIAETARHSIWGPDDPRVRESNQSAYAVDEANAAHIVKCVNLHEAMADLLARALVHLDCDDLDVAQAVGLDEWVIEARAMVAKAKADK